jgi:hypothetical protein
LNLICLLRLQPCPRLLGLKCLLVLAFISFRSSLLLGMALRLLVD